MRSKVLGRTTVLCAVAVVGGFVTCGDARAIVSSDAALMTLVSVKDARDLLTEAGANVQKVDYDRDGFTITATVGPERHIWFEGMECKGVRDAMACPEFKISASWQLKTPARAAELARQLNYNYTSVFADGANLDLWRMDFTYGDITREHLHETIVEFLDLRQKAEKIIWPPVGH